MTYRSRSTSATARPRPAAPLRTEAFLPAVLLVALSAAGGRLTVGDFSVSTAATNITAGDTLKLTPREWMLLKVFGDSVFGAGTPGSYAVDCGESGTDRLAVYWARVGTSQDSVFRTEFVLGEVLATKLPRQIVYGRAVKPVSYLHGCGTSEDYLAVFTDEKYKGKLIAGNGTASLILYDLGQGAYGALCRAGPRSYFVTHRLDNNALVLRQISTTTSRITVEATQTAFVNSGGLDVITNSSVAVDSLGTILILCLRGPSFAPKKLEYKVLTPGFAVIDSGVLADSVSNQTDYTYYEDAPVVSYAQTRFAAAHWNDQGVYLDTITRIDGSTIRFGSRRIVSGSGFRSATIASNGVHLLVAWKGNLTGNSTRSVEGLRFRIQNGGAIDWSNPDTLVLSAPGQPLDDSPTGVEINVAMDPGGSIVAAWPGRTHASGSVWAYRGVRHREGSWVSAALPVDKLPEDSVWFVPGTVVDLGPGGYTRDSVRVGPSAASFAGWSPWVALDDGAGLAQYTKGTHGYVQFASRLFREPLDSLRGPWVDSIAIAWNLQPRLVAIDSVRVDGVRVGPVAFGDTIAMLSRTGSAECFFTGHDGDMGDTVFTLVSWNGSIADTLVDTFDFPAVTVLSPVDSSDSIYECRIDARDNAGWSSVPRRLFVRATNNVPSLAMTVAWDSGGTGSRASVPVADSLRLYMQATDSLEIGYRGDDGNDTAIAVVLALNSNQASSAKQGTGGLYRIDGDGLSAWEDTFALSIADPDTVILKRVFVRTNYPPSIDSALFASATVIDSGAVPIAVGTTERVSVRAVDDNVGFWDSLTYRFTTETFDSVQSNPTFEFVPTVNDSTLRVIVTDRFDKADTVRARFFYPWYAVDPARNPAYGPAIDTLANHLSVILGRDGADTIEIPVVNTGNDTLRLTGILFAGSSEHWLRVGIVQDDTLGFHESLEANGGYRPIVLAPDSSTTIYARIDPVGLFSDDVVRDTIFIATNDLVHPADTVTVLLEHNDLPVLDSIFFDFTPGTPYWLGKKSRRSAAAGYRFPPHARIGMRFSEAMDSASVAAALSCYSVLDSAARGSVAPIVLTPSWSGDYRTVTLAPSYSLPNRSFGDVLPPEGFFLPTDSISLVLAGSAADRATTPSGPNLLDLDRDFAPDGTAADTTVRVRVDSISFTVVEVSPANGAAGIGPDTAITLTFSAPLYPGSIDTSRVANRTLLVATRYNSRIDPARQVPFDTVIVTGNRVTFVPAKSFFYGDSINCYYRGATGRDTLGYPIDLDGDGVPAAFIDPNSTDEDVSWHFAVADLVHQAVSPDSGATGVPGRTPLVVRFGGPVYEGTVDTSSTANKSLIVTSRCSGGSQIAFDSVRIDGSRVTFYPAVRFYYGDSVHCHYQGLVTTDSARFAIDMGPGGLLSSSDDRQWHFGVEELSVVGVTPDSGSAGALPAVPVTISFSGPVWPAIFDTSSGHDNASLGVVTRYSGSGGMALSGVTLSSDGTTVTVRLAEKLFSNDSVACVFAGVSRDYRYGTGRTYLPGPSVAVVGGYSWFFKTEKVGFYTYPNPYKPGKDARHRQTGGIWFKNLHALSKRATDVRVRVYNMNTHPVYDTKVAGVKIRLVEGDPDIRPSWKWDTRNTAGSDVASGVYFFLISGKDDKTLAKGKVMIVR